MSGQRQHYQLCLSEMIAAFLMEAIKKSYIKLIGEKKRKKKKGFFFVGPVLSLEHWPNEVCSVAYFIYIVLHLNPAQHDLGAQH